MRAKLQAETSHRTIQCWINVASLDMYIESLVCMIILLVSLVVQVFSSASTQARECREVSGKIVQNLKNKNFIFK